MPGKSCGCTGKSKQSPHRGTEGTERIVLSTEERLNFLQMQKNGNIFGKKQKSTRLSSRCVAGLRKKKPLKQKKISV